MCVCVKRMNFLLSDYLSIREWRWMFDVILGSLMGSGEENVLRVLLEWSWLFRKVVGFVYQR